MGKINFYQEKYRALDSFYGWVEDGSEYDIALYQSVYYDHPKNELVEIIYYITITSRFCRIERALSQTTKSELESLISKFKTMDLKEYGLTDDEVLSFTKEVEEVERYMQMF